MNKFDDKTVIVTGGGGGIGGATCRRFASEGAKVVINDLDAAPAAQTVADIVARGGHAVACVGSVTDADFADRFVKQALDSFGGIDIIVNNAGYTWDNVIQKMTDEQWYAMLDCHLTAPFRILRAAQPVIRGLARADAEAGRRVVRKVVNISSTSGVYGNAGQANYAAAKAGINGLTKAMAKEWGRYKVNVNSVAFGLIMTRLTQPLTAGDASVDIQGRTIAVGVQPDRLKAAESTIPLGRGGTPEEAAGAVYMFCIPESNYVSGQVLVCGGGRP